MDQEQTNVDTQHESHQAATSSRDLKPIFALMNGGISPRLILNQIAPGIPVAPDASDIELWRSIMNIFDPPKRKKLIEYNTLNDALRLIRESRNIIVLSGAGISTSAGIPDFRSRDGIYKQIHAQYPDLRDPKMMFDISYFMNNPLPFFQFAKALFPGQFTPTIGHKFIKSIEDNGKLLRNYTQNIDTLEKQTGIQRVIECHGSFAGATCTNCRRAVDGESIRNQVLSQTVPRCLECEIEPGSPSGLGVMKPNIVFFGEQLGDEFHRSFDQDRDKVDLLIVIGSSLKVKPVALIPRSIPENVPQILINRETLEHVNFDIELLGNCDDIIKELCLRLGQPWIDVCGVDVEPLNEIVEIPSTVLDTIDQNDPSCDKNSSSNLGDIEENRLDKETELPKSEPTNATQDVNPGEPAVDETQTKSDINPDDDDDDDEWEDVEIIDSSSSNSSEIDLDTTINLKIPQKSFIFVKPNVYLFEGVELTRAQLRGYAKEPTKTIEIRHKSDH